MYMNKSEILNAFNNHILELFDAMIAIFPEQTRFKNSKVLSPPIWEKEIAGHKKNTIKILFGTKINGCYLK